MFEVLMPIDGNEERGYAQAEAVAALPAAAEITVTLLHVFSDRDRAETTNPRQINGGRAAYERLTEAEIGVEELVRVGDPATEILAAAKELNVDAVVLGGRKRSPLGSLLFGSVTQEVVLDADRPVTITGGVRRVDGVRGEATEGV
ncbi:universal stress protein [Halogeometricum limi]|uniref:Universal stress protein family protein n=1 Tax=Halogeometricum limi TaxID=555875 RepID=A0A1I6GKY7_9EURY|nr:universal stress protein [Halogeometricum limi]SFR42840.1 Universal stress protein family protein [Halogeometricum limi]